ncbi:MAG: hypothetical protein IT562_21565 [Alphaproteobacteria bacterium]|nr:hypothetical protein [Alphaproteobacteria bacterium]
MERIVPITIAFVLGAGAALLVQTPAQTFSFTADDSAGALIEPLAMPSRYPMPSYGAGLAALRQ